jgi:hypothetical protein
VERLKLRWSAGTIENKFSKGGTFLAAKNMQQTHHVYQAIHHNITTKTPPRHTAFSKTTPENTRKSGHFARHHVEREN